VDLIEPPDEVVGGIHHCQADCARVFRDNREEQAVRKDVVPAEPYPVLEDAAMESGEAEMPLVELQRCTQVTADTLFHKVVRPWDFDASDVTHGALGWTAGPPQSEQP